MIIVDLQTRQTVDYLTRNLDYMLKCDIIEQGMRAASQVFIRRGKSNLAARTLHPQSGTRNLSRAFAIKSSKQWHSSAAGYIRKGSHAHLVDRGTKRRTTQKGLDRGMMPANYFWTNARDSEERPAMEAILSAVEEVVYRLNNRM